LYFKKHNHNKARVQLAEKLINTGFVTFLVEL